ncbi:MAG: hypothetical protein IJ499_05990 [Clostridia bacterium]|nr:hypothetical protein [Clostridia bacterium]
MKKIISVLLTLVIVSLSVCSCSPHSKEEIVSAAAELIEKSYEVNEIYYGKGLPYTDDIIIGITSEYALVDAEACGYSSVDDLKKAAQAVYSTDYCEHLFKVAFEGLSTEELETVSFARYIEDFGYQLTILKEVKETGLTLNRTYDLSTITVEKSARNAATVSVMSLVDGVEDEVIKINLIYESNGWRLNTPTY